MSEGYGDCLPANSHSPHGLLRTCNTTHSTVRQAITERDRGSDHRARLWAAAGQRSGPHTHTHVSTHNKLVLILTRHTLARAGLANRLLDRHEVVTIDGDVVTLGQLLFVVVPSPSKSGRDAARLATRRAL